MTENFVVTGMTCSACSAHVEKAVRKVSGVESVAVNLMTGRMSNNSTVHFPGEADLIGQILPIKLVECKGFYYIGEQV